jgi:hypothetical protein
MKVCGEMLNAQEARLMGQLSRLPRKVEGPDVPSLPPRMSLGIKTAVQTRFTVPPDRPR